MKNPRWLTACLFVAFVTPAGGAAQSHDEFDIQGAWEVVERSFVRADSSWTNAHPEPGFYLFTETRYGVQEIRESGPRDVFDEHTTDHERLLAFEVFHAHGGTYEVVGATLRIRALIAKGPNTMNGEVYEYALGWDSGDLVVTRTAAEVGEIRVTKLRRIE